MMTAKIIQHIRYLAMSVNLKVDDFWVQMSIKISHITSEAVTRARLINIQPNIVFQGDDIPPVLADHRHVAVGTRGLQRLLHLCRNGYQGDQGEASSESLWREGCPNLLKQVR